MNLLDIEAFLAAVEHKSMSSAARALFLSKSTVSYRIQELEHELGFELLVREKGQRNVVLTERGARFLPIAKRWIALRDDTAGFCRSESRLSLAIGGVDSINRFLLSPIYLELINRGGLSLTVDTHPSSMIYASVEGWQLDVGFVTSRQHSQNIIATPLLSEPMFWIGQSEHVSEISLADLNRGDEVYIRWSDEYQLWHDNHFDPLLPPWVSITSPSLLTLFLTGGRWAIAPESVARALCGSGGLTALPVRQAPPDRVIYRIENRRPRAERYEAQRVFDAALNDFISRCPSR